jgi:Leucine-rich repeat (LRR) protein
LIALSISNLNIQQFPDLSPIKSLTYLDVSNNQIKANNLEAKIPKKIKYLNFRNSFSGPLPKLIRLPILQYLDIGQNNLVFDEKISSIEIRVIKMDECSFNKEPSFGHIPKLSYLDLKKNDLRTFEFPESSNLFILDLSHNNLNEIPKIPDTLKSLSLNLNENKVKNLKNLEFAIDDNHFLDLRNNLIDDLAIFKNPYFENVGLDLLGNPIKNVSEEHCPRNTRNLSVSSFCDSM